MPGSNQNQVIALLRASPTGTLSEAALKAHFAGKNFAKIVDPMIARGEILRNATREYSINPSYVPPVRTAPARPHITTPTVSFLSRHVLVELSTYHGLTLYPSGLAELTTANSAIVESLIPIGLRQHGTGRRLANPYLPNALRVFNERKVATHGVFNFSSHNDVYAVVFQIEQDNSTMDFRFHGGVGCDFITNYILDPRNDFVRKIAPGTAPAIATALVDDIRNQMVAAGLYDARSLASKVCKYFSEFNSSMTADVFYIDDSFVRESIPYYLDYLFGMRVSHSAVEASTYTQLYDWLSLIHTRVTGGALTKSHFDHLLWYIYRK